MEAAFPGRNLIIGRATLLTAPAEEQQALGRGRSINRNECQRGCSFGAYFARAYSGHIVNTLSGNL
jgi:hypothetical protein